MSPELTLQPVQPLEQSTMEYVGQHRAPELHDNGSNWRQRLGRMAGRAALVLGIATAGSAAYGAVETSQAQASDVTCYGDYCSGRYADETGCDEDAYTIADADVTRKGLTFGVHISKEPGVDVGSGDSNDVIGRLELRHSDTCKTNWARYSSLGGDGSANIMGVNFVGIEQDGGYTQKRDIGGLLNGSPSAVSFTPMIYGPDREYQAFVEMKNFGFAHRGATYWTPA